MLPSYPILTNIGDDETAAPPEGILLWVGLSPLCVFITKSSIISIYHIYAISNAISGVYNHEAVPYELRGVKMFNSAFWVEADSHSSNEETAKYDEVRKEEGRKKSIRTWGKVGHKKFGTEKRRLNARLLISPSQCEVSSLVKDPGVEHVSFSRAE